MIRDPIVEEVRAVRDELAKRHEYDIDAIVRALQKASVDGARQLVAFPPKPTAEKGEDRRAS
jgi:hypothetical protein